MVGGFENLKGTVFAITLTKAFLGLVCEIFLSGIVGIFGALVNLDHVCIDTEEYFVGFDGHFIDD